MPVIELHSLCPAGLVLSVLARMGVKVVWRTMLFTPPDWGLGDRDRSRDTLGWPISSNPKANDDNAASRLPSNFPPRSHKRDCLKCLRCSVTHRAPGVSGDELQWLLSWGGYNSQIPGVGKSNARSNRAGCRVVRSPSQRAPVSCWEVGSTATEEGLFQNCWLYFENLSPCNFSGYVNASVTGHFCRCAES